MGESSKNSPSKKSAKRKKNLTSKKGRLQTKIMNGGVQGTSQTKPDNAINAEEQNNIISDFSDDSDIEVISHICSGEVAMVNSKTTKESISQFEISENASCDGPSSSKNEIVLVDLSETSDDEESDNSVIDAVQYESQTNRAQNEILDESEASDDQMRFEIKTDDLSIDIFHEPDLKIEELELESDEECMMFDFSNYTADDVLKAVENNKLISKKFHSTIKKKRSLVEPPEIQKSTGENNAFDKSIVSDKQVTLETNIESLNEEEVIENSEKESIIDNPVDNNADGDNDDNQAALVLNLDHPYSISTPATMDKIVSETSDVINSNEVLSSRKLSETISSYIVSTCRDCSVAQNLDINKLNKICDSCKRPLLLQCKVCLSSFFSMSLACTHLWKFHDVKIQPNELLPRSELMSVKKANNQVLKNQSDSANDSHCEKCGIQCSLLTNVEKHKMYCKTIVNYSCKFCNAKMIFKEDLKNHLLLEHRRLFKKTELNNILDSIMKNSSEQKGSEHLFLGFCMRCEKRMKLKGNQTRCLKCQSMLIYECGDCSKAFMTLEELHQHVQNFHEPKLVNGRHSESVDSQQSDQLPTLVSNIEGVSKSQVNNHSRYGTNTNDELSTRASTLKHLMTNQTPGYECPNCKKTFKQLRWFRQHNESFCEKLSKWFKCAHCNYKSVSKARLKVHLRCNHVNVFTGKMFRCRKCGCKFTSIFKLNNHAGLCSGDSKKELAKLHRKRNKYRGRYR